MTDVLDLAPLMDAVELARAAAVVEASADLVDGAAAVGAHLDAVAEDGGAVTHAFAAEQGGYRGWRWSVTLAGSDPVSVSEAVLLPGPDALVAPAWVPWDQRIRPGDLGPGDLLPGSDDDERLASAYLASDDPAVEEVAREIGLGRERVMSLLGREDAAERWHAGPHGPGSDMARAAPAPCGTCGFLLPLAGSLRGAFGVCGNAYAPADGAVVEVGFGCGAHSDVRVEQISAVAVAELVYDDGIDLEPVGPTADTLTTDAGTTDAGTTDAGTTDAGTTDAGTTDAGTTDAGTADIESGDGPVSVDHPSDDQPADE